MSNEPPPPYPGGPTAPLLEEKSGAPLTPGRTSPAVMQPPPGMPLPSADIAPPPYEPPGHPVPQPGFVPPHMNADGTYMPAGELRPQIHYGKSSVISYKMKMVARRNFASTKEGYSGSC